MSKSQMTSGNLPCLEGLQSSPQALPRASHNPEGPAGHCALETKRPTAGSRGKLWTRSPRLLTAGMVRHISPEEMKRLFERHRDAEAARDYDAIVDTFVEDCFLETVALGLRSDGRTAVRASYEKSYFAAFPDLDPDDEGYAFGEDVMVTWGTLRGTSKGEWLGLPPSGGSFEVGFANMTPFRDGLMAGERIYFDLATLCDQAGLPLDEVRAAARARAAAS